MPQMTRSKRRDPAPSRLVYRVERMLLTPLYRGLVTTGLPVFAVCMAFVLLLSDANRRDVIRNFAQDVRNEIEQRPEFMVRLMTITGATDGIDADIRELLPVEFPISSFDLDLDAMRTTVEKLDAIASATVRVRSGGVLGIEVSERVPAVVWRTSTGLALLDAAGHQVAPLDERSDRPDLPLILGDGAETVVGEALAVIAAARPLEVRLRGLRRVGQRRWDVMLDRDQRILLPELNPVTALEAVIALNKAPQEILARDVVHVDMRRADRPTLRLGPAAAEDHRRTIAFEMGEN
jgi:cell division protein FtsQ